MCVKPCELLSSLNEKKKQSHISRTSETITKQTIKRLNGSSVKPTCLVSCWWILRIHGKERHHSRLRHQGAVILCCQPHYKWYCKNETNGVRLRGEHSCSTSGGFQVRAHRCHWIILLYLHRSLVCPPHRTHPWPAPRINDYWAAWQLGNYTLVKGRKESSVKWLCKDTYRLKFLLCCLGQFW